MNFSRNILYYLLVEIIILIICYFMIIYGSDNLVGLVGFCLITFAMLGVVFGVYFIVQKLRQKITAQVFNKCFWISVLSLVLPFGFLFIVLSQLH